MRKFLLLTLALVSACSLAPKFKMPAIELPSNFKEVPKDSVEVDGIVWKESEPLEKSDRGQWWKIFSDEKLNALQMEALDANQSLKVIAARVEQSRATANIAKGGLFPSIDIGGNVVRAKSAADSVSFGSSSTNLKPYTFHGGQGVVSYEADLFGRVRDSYKASRLDSDSQVALYKSATLALQADVATNYFLLRSLDAERKLLNNTVKVRTEASRIMQKRFKEGDASEQDIARTKSELAGVQADLIALDRYRAKIEHAIAVLVGKTPADFTFPQLPLEGVAVPLIPAGIPSTLLERRPDVAAALASMQAANSRIGVAKAAFFPSLTLTASGGFSSTSLGNLFNTSSQSWALGQVAGNALALPVFHGGRNSANLKSARSSYDEAIANYHQQVLVAFRDVEDTLVDQHMLADQSLKHDEAAKEAKKTTAIAKRRYSEGETDYFEVVDSERVSLVAERIAVQARGQRFIATVAMIRALGGGWDEVLGK